MAGPTISSSDQQQPEQTMGQIMTTLALCAWYIAISAGLINFNKHMMSHGRFPHAIALTTLHVTVTFVCSSLMYVVRPSLFPSMNQAWEKRRDLSRYFIPVSMLFIVGVVCSNQAYLYCNVAFLQFMKEWNVGLVFVFSCMAGFTVCDRVKFFVILWIVLAACTAVTGDMRFSRLGFMIQACSQFGETTRIVIQEWLLSGSQIKLDPLTYQLFVGPPTLLFLVAVNLKFWDPTIVADLYAWWPYLAANASCAVLLNLTIAVLIKHAGGLAFVLSGVVKDVVIVCVSNYISGAGLNVQQTAGFAAALFGIFYWGMIKSAPSHSMVTSLNHVLGLPTDVNDKKRPSVSKSEKALNDEETVTLMSGESKQRV